MSARMEASELGELAELLAAVGHDVQWQGDMLVARWIGEALPPLVVDIATATWWLDVPTPSPRPAGRLVAALRGDRAWAWPCSGASAPLRHVIALLAEVRGTTVVDLVEAALRAQVARLACGDDADAVERADLVLWSGSTPPPR